MNTHVHDVLQALEQRAAQRDELDAAWQAATGAIEILLWCDDFSRAATLAETTIHDLARQGTDLEHQMLPFGLALTAADTYAGEPSLPRLQAASAALPETATLGQHLARVADQVRTSSAGDNVSLPTPWTKPGRRLARRDRELLDRDWSTLSPHERRNLWNAAERTNDLDLARQLDHVLGSPTEWSTAMWFAQWLVHTGHPLDAARVLTSGHQHYLPRAPWSLLPINPPADPVLREALSAEVRATFLATLRDPTTDPE